MNLGTRPRGFTPSRKDLGQTDVDQLLSVRLQRRLPGSQRQSQPPNPREQRPRQNLGATNPRPSAYKPTSAGPKKPRAGGGARKPNRPSRPVRGALTRTDQADASEPDVPLTPAVIPPRIYNLTYLSNLTSPSPSTTHTSQNSDPVQRVREKIGGDYSKWMSKEDIAAAGKDKDVSTIARARLALAFNPTITPQNRQKLVDTTQMLLNKGKPSGVVASS